jgi:Flp pilus assembly protein TadG
MSALRQFVLERRGNIAIMTALAAPVMVGFCGLGAETGYWYFRQTDIQAASDIAAYNATLTLRGGGSQSQVVSTATSDAGNNGWHAAQGTITVNTPPASGPNQNTRAVEVLLTENEQRYFTSLFSSGTVPVSSRSVAMYLDAGNACMVGLDKTKSNTVQFWGNADADFTACNIVSDSSSSTAFTVGGSANVTVPCADVVGGDSVTSGLVLTQCGSVTTGSPYVPDPYRNVASPSVGACQAASNPMNPGTYCGGLTFQGTVTLNPGVYVINGGTLKFNANANVTGAGVTFYLTNGATLDMNGGAQVNLSAPTSGAYSGLVFYGDRTQASAVNKINGNASSTITGAIYFPSQELDFLGNFSGANGCTQVVADVIYYTGSSTFRTNCTGTGMATIEVPGSVRLVE